MLSRRAFIALVLVLLLCFIVWPRRDLPPIRAREEPALRKKFRARERTRAELCAQKYSADALQGLLALATEGNRTLRVFIASLLHNNADVLPGWMAAVEETVHLLGRPNVHISVLESGSTDGTDLDLREWGAKLTRAGIANTIVVGGQPPMIRRAFKHRDRRSLRIEFLAKLRNVAIDPMVVARGPRFDRLIFINDIIFCAGDLLRLVAHTRVSGAALACGLDFNDHSPHRTDFYDKWVLTDLDGHHQLPANVGGGAHTLPRHKRPGVWLSAEMARGNCPPVPEPCAARFEKPAHVYCCWNGVAVFDAAAFYDDGLRFRWSTALDPGWTNRSECANSECSLACKDLWRVGKGRVLLDPAVQVGYSYRVHRAWLRTFSAVEAVLPSPVALDAPQPKSWDCYQLRDPGERKLEWTKPPVRESLEGNRGPLPYGPDWRRWPAVQMAAAEVIVDGAAEDGEAKSGAFARGVQAGVLVASVIWGALLAWRALNPARPGAGAPDRDLYEPVNTVLSRGEEDGG